MSDILLQALMGANSQEEYENPWLRGAAGIQQQQQESNGYEMKPWQRLLVGALGGLGQGVSTGIGKSQLDASANLRNQNIMGGMRSGKLLEAINSDPYLAKYAPMIENEQAQGQAQQAQIQEQRRHELTKALLPKGLMLGEDNRINRVFDPNEDEIDKALAIESGKMQLERQGGPSAKELRTLATDFNDKLRAMPQERTYSEVRRQTGTLFDALKLDNPVAATAAIYSLAKVLDPSSVVREGEYKIVADPGSPVNAFNSVLKQIQGEGRLTDETKANIESILTPILNNTYGSYSEAANTYLDTLENVGGDRSAIGLLPKYELGGGSAAPGAPEGFASTGRTSGGKPVYKNANGQLWTPD